MFLYDLGAAVEVPKCAKSVVLPAGYMSSTDANYLPGFTSGSSSTDKGTNWVPILIGAAVAGAIVWWAVSNVGALPPIAANPGRAKKLGVTAADVDPEQLRVGTEHELEHTDDRKKARQIALDHLAEMPDYYTRLATIEP